MAYKESIVATRCLKHLPRAVFRARSSAAMGNEHSKKASSEDRTSRSTKSGVVSALRPGPSISTAKLQTHLENARKSRVLQLEDKGIKQIPAEIYEITKALRSLNLASNKLVALTPRIGEFTNLKHLNLARNRLEELADEVGCLKHLETLDVSNNRLTALPQSLAGCASLKTLNAAHNQLNIFPIGACHAQQLEHLDLASNCLSALPDDVGELSAIELSLNKNQLNALNDKLADCKNLRILRVEENCLEKRAFSVAILKDSKLSLIVYAGNLFQDSDFQNLAGFDEYQQRYTATKLKGV